MQVKEVTPIFRIFDYDKAVEFYIDWLGFKIDWVHRFEANFPTYMQISGYGMTLHLSEHHGDASPGAKAFITCTGIHAFHELLIQKNYKYNKPGLEKTFYDTYCVQVIDPFGNRISFNEPINENKMEPVFKFIFETRHAFIKLVDELSLEELNRIPEGFNNNIIWNFGHIVVTTPALVYTRTGIREGVNWIKYVDSYAKGTKPAYTVKQEEVDELKQLAIESIKSIEADYLAGKLNQISSFETVTYGATLSTISDVLTTTSGHDNVHYGYAIAQKRIINLNK